MSKIYRLIGKEGRTTIPFDIRLKMRIGYNSLLSYEMKDENTIILRREKVCDHCSDHGVKEGSIKIAADFDLDAGTASACQSSDNAWWTYSLKDLSTAAYRANRGSYRSSYDRKEKFEEALAGKEIVPPEETEDEAPDEDEDEAPVMRM